MSLEAAVQQNIDQKTKPLGSLGQLEDIAKQICLIQQTQTPELKNPHIVVFAADHGLASHGVSAYPQEVTGQMVLNFVAGGAAINVLSKQNGIELTIADVGVIHEFDPRLPIQHLKVGHGTADSNQGNAMTSEQLETCTHHATRLVRDLNQNGCNVIGFGEMGIGNTSAATLIFHLISGFPLDQCIGRGTGLDDEGLQKKHDILRCVAKRHASAKTPRDILLAVGGFEIANIAASMDEAARLGMVILVDGFIASAAALLAAQTKPDIKNNMIFCHTSAESGHANMLEYMNARAILDLGLRLGEGTGCALAYPIIESSIAFYNGMASFESAEISGRAE